MRPLSFLVDGKFAHGKYEGQVASDVARRDPSYIDWVWASRDNLALSIDEEGVFLDILHPTPPIQVLDEPPWAHWPKVWSEDDATMNDPDHESVCDAWVERYGEDFDEKDAIAVFDGGDCMCYLMAGGRVLEQSYPGNSRILQCPPPPPPPLALVPYAETVEGVVDDLPPPPPPAGFFKPRVSVNWNEGQRAALDAIERWKRGHSAFTALTGPAGAGKSTLLREVVESFTDVTLTAMTGKAALRVAQLTECNASTLHAKMYYPPQPGQGMKFTRLREAPSKYVVVDESSMMTPSVFRDFERWGVRAILVGDPYQLPPVITGEELQEFGEDYSVFSHVGGVELTEVMRSAGGVLRAATRVRETGQICEQSDMDAPDEGYEYVREHSPIERAVDEFCAKPIDHLLVTWKNSTRMNANRMIRERIGREGPLPDDGEPVLLKKNGQGHLNGEIVECGGFETGPTLGGSVRTLWMRVGRKPPQEKILVSIDGGSKERGGEMFDGQMPWIENWKKYHVDLKKLVLPDPVPITWGYCGTCHSVQGSESKRVTVFLERSDVRSRNFRKPTTLPDGRIAPFSARFVYTATTRSKHHSILIVGK